MTPSFATCWLVSTTQEIEKGIPSLQDSALEFEHLLAASEAAMRFLAPTSLADWSLDARATLIVAASALKLEEQSAPAGKTKEKEILRAEQTLASSLEEVEV
ncbi:hypothetical protein PINS_up022793 [Pythium insidiosum]|nr:hypothetical protein PINS_up022793 [Pythium insidiosum]